MTVESAAGVTLSDLPGEPVAYKLEAGTGRSFLLGGQVMRFLASRDETSGAMAVSDVVGPAGVRIPAHSHEVQHDLLYIARGKVQVWADGESRILTAGDVASLPPGTKHCFATLAHNSEIIGPVDWHWVRFFELLGSPYPGPAYPAVDDSPRPSPEQFKQIVAEHLQVPQPDYVFPEPRFDAADDVLPVGEVPYFLRAGEGPRHMLAGQVCFQVLTGAQSGGRMAMTVTEGSTGAQIPVHLHERTAEGIYCLDGEMRVFTDGDEHHLSTGDYVNVPAGVEHTYMLDSNFTRFASMIAPAGIERFFEVAGEVAEYPIFTPDAVLVDAGRLTAAAAELDIVFSDAGS